MFWSHPLGDFWNPSANKKYIFLFKFFFCFNIADFWDSLIIMFAILAYGSSIFNFYSKLQKIKGVIKTKR